MDREFLRFYNQELAILREQAAEFAEDYPGIAERLGGLVGDAADPMISGLLEGTAFLAARVQLKLKHEFADFTTNLIDQLAPHYLAPTPSFVLVRAKPKFGDPALRDGRTIAQGSVRRLPVHARGVDNALALRYRQGGVSDQLRSLPGSSAERPHRLRREPQTAANRAQRDCGRG
jgi:type VI secretion system protein ImpG